MFFENVQILPRSSESFGWLRLWPCDPAFCPRRGLVRCLCIYNVQCGSNGNTGKGYVSRYWGDKLYFAMLQTVSFPDCTGVFNSVPLVVSYEYGASS